MHTLNDIRSAFLGYFEKNGHQIVPSAPLVPKDDPTLMFVNAGMVPFKNVFTGLEKRDYVRATSSQKCVRAGGKHNDLDNVGTTARHHTFFEMLGNFSFGDYFKEEAIHHGWSFLTKELGVNPEKLLVTVYHEDDEAFNWWKKIAGLADDKIIRIATSDNFWSMGDTGPCGPCSEIFYDHGEHIAGGPPGSADENGDRFVEIWNLVFMQYDQIKTTPPLVAGGGEAMLRRGGNLAAKGEIKRIPLPKPSIDTGMGLERMAAVMQGVHDNYETDLFKKLIEASEKESGSQGASSNVSHRVIADHLRSSAFLIADGVTPSNEGRGYVLRRIMRRAMRHAHMLGCAEPLMHRLVPALVEQMGGQYEELDRAQANIIETLYGEEERFKQTLGRGLKLLEEEIVKSCGAQSTSAGSRQDAKDPVQPPPHSGEGSQDERILPGEIAFKLYDTYGFPLDLTEDILRAEGISIDTKGFDKCMAGQREMARSHHKGSGSTATDDVWFKLKEQFGETQFVGYEQNECEATVLAIVQDGEIVESARAGEAFIILDKTPFYGESGGQVGDVGILKPCGTQSVSTGSQADSRDPVQALHASQDVIATKKPLEHFHVHTAVINAPIKTGDAITASIDKENRTSIRANHSATHLMHKALRDVLGEHVTQKGSLVDADKLRFDFSHGKAVTKEEIEQVEHAVNAAIARATSVSCEVMSPDDAIKAGAMALFGEKYGDEVRVLTIGANEDSSPYSVELCGGTHVGNTGDIGLFAITSEGSVAAGIRRIEAVTGEDVRAYYMGSLKKLDDELQALQITHTNLVESVEQLGFKVDEFNNQLYDLKSLESESVEQLTILYNKLRNNIKNSISGIQEANKKANKHLGDLQSKAALADASANATKEVVGDITFIHQTSDGLPPKELRNIVEALLKEAKKSVAFVATVNEKKVSLVIGVSQALEGKIDAVPLLKSAVEILGGKGGGGKWNMAQGGGVDTSQIDTAIEKIKSEIAAQ